MASLTNEVIDGVVAAIADEFNSVPVYDEALEQGLPEPSFFVRSIQPRQALFLGRRYKRTELIEVTYFPPLEDRNRKTNEVLETLFSILEIITAGNDRLRGSDMQAHIDDESQVGVFTVIYRYFVDVKDADESPVLTDFTLKGVDVT